ncbi:MAG: mechanosensitive ion channel [Proteobacteria bacterium]|jgi:MscS family membrane protein|nr:mechanosensitive ion channel [Pseudomonadota bacterium]
MDTDIEESQLSDAWAVANTWWPESPWLQALIVIGIGLFLSLLAIVICRIVLRRIARGTTTSLDDQVLERIEPPLALSIVLLSVWEATNVVQPPEPLPFAIRGLIVSIIVVLWGTAAVRISDLTFVTLLEMPTVQWVQPKTAPLMKLAGRLIVVGGAAYFFFLAWDLDLTGWLASAGILGIAVGFAAKDTLANLVAGVFILIDTPYKLGDYLVLDSGERGRVVKIGARTTRLITRDDIEIVIPNANMSNATILNQSGGNDLATRLSATVEAAYGSDVNKVRGVLLAIPPDLPHVVANPPPAVHFSTFGASGLVFKLRVWVDKPEYREPVLDEMNTLIYNRFAKEGIEIPYSKHDVYLHQSNQ